MANYLILIYLDEAEVARDSHEISASYAEFMERRQSALRGGAALEPATTATSLRQNGDGDFIMTDGPFAESKEALGGYYLIEAADLDEALAIAREVPASAGVEVRPLRMAS
jgi:hypothetical protein